jgi:hypothetical protein
VDRFPRQSTCRCAPRTYARRWNELGPKQRTHTVDEAICNWTVIHNSSVHSKLSLFCNERRGLVAAVPLQGLALTGLGNG